MARKNSTVIGAEEPTEVKMKATGNQSAVSIDGDEYEVEADGTIMVAADLVSTFQSHGFEVVPNERASKKAAAK